MRLFFSKREKFIQKKHIHANRQIFPNHTYPKVFTAKLKNATDVHFHLNRSNADSFLRSIEEIKVIYSPLTFKHKTFTYEIFNSLTYGIILSC